MKVQSRGALTQGLLLGSWDKSDFIAAIGIAVALFLALSPPVFFPYLLLDDNWIMRSGDKHGSYPDLSFIAVVQGRPIFAALIFLSRQLALLVGAFDAMIVLRISSVALICYAGIIIYKFIRELGLAWIEAASIAIGAMTLPSIQVIVANGVWLAVPLLSLVFAVYLMHADLRRGHSFTRIVPITQFLLLLTLATYQSIVLVAFSFVLLSILFGTKPNNRFILYVITNVVLAIFIYGILWLAAFHLLQYDSLDQRYSPTNIHFDVIAQLRQLLDIRLPQALNLWRISTDHLGYVTLSFIFGAALVTAHSSKYNVIQLKDLLMKVAVILVLMVITDAIPLASRQPVLSYTTLYGLSLTVYFSVSWALRQYSMLFFHTSGISSSKLFIGAFTAIGLVGCLYTINRHLAIPAWAQTELVREQLRGVVAVKGGIDRIFVYRSAKLFGGGGVYEYEFSNLQNDFYVKWSIKNILRDIGVSDDAEIKIRTARQKFATTDLMTGNGVPLRIAVVDLNALNERPLSPLSQNPEVHQALGRLAAILRQGDDERFNHELTQAIHRHGSIVLDIDPESGRGLLSESLCQKRHSSTALLLKMGADPNRIDANGAMPIACVTEKTQLEKLIKFGLNEKVADAVGMTALHVLVERNRVELVRHLLDAGYSPSLRGRDGRLPLHTAAYYGYTDMIRLLLSRGSKINVHNYTGVTPLDWAISNQRVEVVDILRSAGALTSSEIRRSQSKWSNAFGE